MGRGDSLPKPGEDRALSGKSDSKNEKLRLRGDDVITHVDYRTSIITNI